MSIKDHALIVSMSVGKPQMTKKDQLATQAAEVATNANKAGKYQKDLYPARLIKPIIAVESAARAWINRNCYQWGRNSYLLPSTRFMTFADGMAQIELQFDQAVTAFMQNWSYVLREAEQTQGDMFDPDEYPDVHTLRKRFRFEVSYSPVTDTNDFRVKIQEDELDILRSKVEQDTKAKYDDMLAQPLERLRDAVAKLNERMGQEDRVVINKRTGNSEVRAPIFKDTIVLNVVDEINLLKDLADCLPAETLAIADETMEVLTNPIILRESSAARADTKQQTDKLLAAINGLLED